MFSLNNLSFPYLRIQNQFPMPKYTLHINGSEKVVDTEPDTPLLYVLRDDLELNGPKFGCGIAQCGSCMVLIDGNAVISCIKSVGSVGDSKVVTLEGLANENGKLHPVQEALWKNKQHNVAIV